MAVNVEIGNYIISTDAHQYILREWKENKATGEKYLENIGYCTSALHLRTMIQFSNLKKEEITSLKEWSDFIKNQDELYGDILKNINFQKEESNGNEESE